MRHLRDQHGIEISGSKQKKDLLNIGYYHGYKGYRFIGQANHQIPYTNFDEVVGVYEFDTNLKTIFYPRIMFIETAIKNYTLNTLIGIGPADFDFVFSHLLNDYKKENTGNSKYRDKMKKRLDLRNKINQQISYNYSEQKDESSRSVKEYLQSKTGINNITFDTIVDYFIILIFLLKKRVKTNCQKVLC